LTKTKTLIKLSMNKTQTEALKSAITYLDSVSSIVTGERSEDFGEPNIHEVALMGYLHLEILTEAFPKIAAEVLSPVVVNDENQMKFEFALDK
jgi:hypothetical protein